MKDQPRKEDLLGRLRNRFDPLALPACDPSFLPKNLESQGYHNWIDYVNFKNRDSVQVAANLEFAAVIPLNGL
jgi:hypothetical protein